MTTEGAAFADVLRDAQDKGYAERNPDADVLGIDACRKIAILPAITTDKLLPTDLDYTTIGGLRLEAAEKLISELEEIL